MQMKMFTDYAIRILLYVAAQPGVIPSGEVSRSLNIPQSIVLKIANRLKHRGIMLPLAGIKGGLTLMKKPEEITLIEVMEEFEASLKVSKCLEEKHADRFGEGDASIKRFYKDFQKVVDERLRETTIQTLLEG